MAGAKQRAGLRKKSLHQIFNPQGKQGWGGRGKRGCQYSSPEVKAGCWLLLKSEETEDT